MTLGKLNSCGSARLSTDATPPKKKRLIFVIRSSRISRTWLPQAGVPKRVNLLCARSSCASGRRRGPAAFSRQVGHVAIVKNAIKLAEPDVDALAAHWEKALSAMDEPARREALSGELAVLIRERAESLYSIERYEAASNLVDGASRFLPDTSDFEAIHVRALTDWGIQVANHGDAQAGVAPLRRATKKSPHMTRARQNFVRVAHRAARCAVDVGEFDKALALLVEAESYLVREGNGLTDAEQDLIEESALAYTDVFAAQAVVHFAAGEYGRAVELFESALARVAHPMSNSTNRASADT
jgi:tetratricopeptide (TPR) repeat protein